MTGSELQSVRRATNWTQEQAALKLHVTQEYLSMVERGIRPVSRQLAEKARLAMRLPATALPLGAVSTPMPDAAVRDELAALGYPGFAYLKKLSKLNPTELLFRALDVEERDSRMLEALPWLAMAYPPRNTDWLIREAKVNDRQNRLAFVLDVAISLAVRKGESSPSEVLCGLKKKLEPSRLAREDTLCHESMTKVEREWLRVHRPENARHWNLLTDLSLAQLTYA